MKTLSVITLERVTLRALESTDRDRLLSIYGDTEAMRYRQRPAITRMEDADRMIEEARTNCLRNLSYRWAIEEHSAGILIGTFIWKRLDNPVPDYIGYVLHKDHWGRGYMTEVLTGMLPYLAEEHGTHVIRAEVDERNTASVRLLERCGFRSIERSPRGRITFEKDFNNEGDARA